jgi:hypothetical protein
MASWIASGSCEWCHAGKKTIWPDSSYEPILSQTIVASVDAVLEANTPSFLESIRLTTFTREPDMSEGRMTLIPSRKQRFAHHLLKEGLFTSSAPHRLCPNFPQDVSWQTFRAD